MNTTNIKRPQAPGSGRYLSLADKLAMREQAIEQIKVMLAEQPMSPAGIAERLGMNKTTVWSYLHHMAGEVRQSGQIDAHRRRLWELGEGALSERDEQFEQGIAPKRAFGPARQIGMQRDPWVAAVFGAAQGATA